MKRDLPIVELYTLQETANVLVVHRMTLAALVNSGELNGVKIGRRWRFRQRDIDEYLERQFDAGTHNMK